MIWVIHNGHNGRRNRGAFAPHPQYFANQKKSRVSKQRHINQCIVIRLKYAHSSVDIRNHRYAYLQNFWNIRKTIAPPPHPKNVPPAFIFATELFATSSVAISISYFFLKWEWLFRRCHVTFLSSAAITKGRQQHAFHGDAFHIRMRNHIRATDHDGIDSSKVVKGCYGW